MNGDWLNCFVVYLSMGVYIAHVTSCIEHKKSSQATISYDITNKLCSCKSNIYSILSYTSINNVYCTMFFYSLKAL